MDEKTVARFWSKVDKNGPAPAHVPEVGPCWVWTGSRTAAGYGRHCLRPGTTYAHRFSKEIHGDPPGSMSVLHRCDNPPCVNPAHLFLGTDVDNKADMVRKARQARGARLPQAILSAADAAAILANPGRRTQRQLAADFMVSTGTISDVVMRRTWAHVPIPAGGIRASRRALSGVDIEYIRSGSHGLSNREVAQCFGVTPGYVSMIRAGLRGLHSSLRGDDYSSARIIQTPDPHHPVAS